MAGKATDGSTRKLLERVQMSETDRREASAALAQGEQIAQFLLDACATLRSAFNAAERGVRAITGTKQAQ